MPIMFSCPECASLYEVEDDLAGKTVRCRECDTIQRVPTAVNKPSPPAADPQPCTPKLSPPAADPQPSKPITFRCAECSETYEVENDLAGKAIRCRECQALNRVTSPFGVTASPLKVPSHEPFTEVPPIIFKPVSPVKQGLACAALGGIFVALMLTAVWLIWLRQGVAPSPAITPIIAQRNSAPAATPASTPVPARPTKEWQLPKDDKAERTKAASAPRPRMEEPPAAPPASIRTTSQPLRRIAPPQLSPGLPKEKATFSDADRLRIRRLLAEQMAKRPKPEPLDKPTTWTKREYLLGLSKAKIWQKLMDNPSNLYWNRAKPIFLPASENDVLAAQLLPESCAHWKREALLQALSIPQDRLDGLITGPFSYLREIKDNDFRRWLRERAPWQKRALLFKDFAAITGDERPWGLHHPFDDMPETWMKEAIEAARIGKQKGYLALCPNKEEGERLLGALLWADQLEFLDSLLLSPEEIHARQVAEERQRQAAEEEARRRAEEQRRQAKIDEQEQQRQAKIDEQDRQAKKLLHAALQLNTRSGFAKQVKRRLQEIIDKYPDTPSARRAQEQLEGMK